MFLQEFSLFIYIYISAFVSIKLIPQVWVCQLGQSSSQRNTVYFRLLQSKNKYRLFWKPTK